MGNDTRLDVMEIGNKDVDWIHLDQWAVVNTVMNLRVPQNSRNFLIS
jgi:hypothetical protein